MDLFGLIKTRDNLNNLLNDISLKQDNYTFNCKYIDNTLSVCGGSDLSLDNCFLEDVDYVLFLDGIMYNTTLKDLINKIKSSKLDITVLNQLIKQIDGEFVIILYCKKDLSLFLIRDHFGTRPLYFSIEENNIVWSSRCYKINQLKKHSLCCVPEERLIPKEPYTSFNGIWQVPPSTYLKICKGNLELICYNFWEEGDYNEFNLTKLHDCIEHTLIQKFTMGCKEIAIPMSAGIDSGILAFYADKLKLDYHVFSLVEVMGKPTVESKYIYKRIDRLKNAKSVNLIKCNNEEYEKALAEIYKPRYYETFRKSTGIIPIHTIFSSIKEKGIATVIDGTGGDELFHGYNYREQFHPVPFFPENWKKNNMFYSIYAVLLENTEHVERAGRFFDLQSRFPFQNRKLYNLSKDLIVKEIKKWPLRKFLFDKTNYGLPMKPDYDSKYGLCMDHFSKRKAQADIRLAFCKSHNITNYPHKQPLTCNLIPR